MLTARSGRWRRTGAVHIPGECRVCGAHQAGAKLADEFYTETCRRLEELTSRFAPAERDTLAALLGRVVGDNKVPTVFMEPDRMR
ncbi:hypothetical protein [Nonomuraea sp. CA-141351]|uniref:hypothetical protein n=1 Tax=Nonomuraea sp. CA-141351 TaxID=3239996 RepID=UPI003D92F6D8